MQNPYSLLVFVLSWDFFAFVFTPLSCRQASRTLCPRWPTPRPSTSGPASVSSLSSVLSWNMPWSTMLQGEDIFFHQIGIKYWVKSLGCGKLKYCNQGLTLRGPRSRRKWRRRSSSFVPSMPSTLRTRGTHNHWWDLFETRMLSMVTPLCWVTAECGATVKVCLSQLSKVSLRVHRTKVDQKIILNLKRFLKRSDWGHRQPLAALEVRKESRLESGQSTGHSVCVCGDTWQCGSVWTPHCGDTWHLGKQRLGPATGCWGTWLGKQRQHKNAFQNKGRL